jgi:hypothetical protein
MSRNGYGICVRADFGVQNLIYIMKRQFHEGAFICRISIHCKIQVR